MMGPVQTGRFERQNISLKKIENEIGRFTSYDQSNRENEAQLTSWARSRFIVLLNCFGI